MTRLPVLTAYRLPTFIQRPPFAPLPVTMPWHNIQTNPPAIFVEVLLAYAVDPTEHDGRGHDVGEGFRLPDDTYQFSTGHSAPTVYAWLEIPAAPSPAALGIKTNTPGDDAIVS